MGRRLRLAGYVVATVLLPLVALAVGIVGFTDIEDEDVVFRIVLVVAAFATVASYLSLRVAHRAVAKVTDVLTERARGIATGHLGGEPVPVTGPPEVAALTRAFNDVIATVRAQVLEQERSQGEFRRAVEHLGTALSGAHDPAAIAAVTVETAHLVTGCRTAVLWRVDGSDLQPDRTLGEARIRGPITLGEGLAGRAAAAGAPRTGEDRAGGEPHHEHAMVAPLEVDGAVWGVLGAYGRSGVTTPYSGDDLATLVALARQAAVAIENAQLHAEATRLSVTDPLTGLANRRELERRLELEVERAERFGEPCSVAVIDLDDFKHVNDTYGHPAGDAVLVEVAARLRRATRSVDLVARSGGEELAVVLPNADRETAGRAAARLRQAIAQRPVTTEHAEVPVTASIGVATYPEHGRTAHDLVAAADEALYRAKRAGKNRVERALER